MDIRDPKANAQALRELADLVEQGRVHLSQVEWNHQYQDYQFGPQFDYARHSEHTSTTIKLTLVGPPAIFQETFSEGRQLPTPAPKRLR